MDEVTWYDAMKWQQAPEHIRRFGEQVAAKIPGFMRMAIQPSPVQEYYWRFWFLVHQDNLPDNVWLAYDIAAHVIVSDADAIVPSVIHGLEDSLTWLAGEWAKGIKVDLSSFS